MKSVLRQMPVYLAEVFMMFPMAYILVLGEIDISVGAIVCLSATLSCMVCNTNAPFIVVVLTALVVGALCGAVNGFILTRFKELPPMIVTLATQIIFRGIAEVTLGAGGSIAITNTDTTTGNGFEMDAIAMAVFGGISSTGGKGNLAGGIISAFIIVCLRVGLGQKNVNAQVILLIIGVLLVAAVALPNIIGDVKKAVAMKKN